MALPPMNLRGALLMGCAIVAECIVAFASGRIDDEALMLITAGPVILLGDAFHRYGRRISMFSVTQGASVCYMPAWVLGQGMCLVGLVKLAKAEGYVETLVWVMCVALALACWLRSLEHWLHNRSGGQEE